MPILTYLNVTEHLVKHYLNDPKVQIFVLPVSRECKLNLSNEYGNRITVLPNGIDPVSNILQELVEGNLAVIFTDDEAPLQKLVPRLQDIRGYSLVVNVLLTTQDYSIISKLKHYCISAFVSNDIKTMFVHGEIAALISRSLNGLVFHFIDSVMINADKLEKYQDRVPIFSIVDVTKFQTPQEIISFFDIPSFKVYPVHSDQVHDPYIAIINASPYGDLFASNLPPDSLLIDVKIYKPWNLQELFEGIPGSVRKLVIVQGCRQGGEYINSGDKSLLLGGDSILLDFFTDFELLNGRKIDDIIHTSVGTLSVGSVRNSLAKILENARNELPMRNLFISYPGTNHLSFISDHLRVKDSLDLEGTYIKALKELFGRNLDIINSCPVESTVASRRPPEYDFGLYLQRRQNRLRLIEVAGQLLKYLECSKTSSPRGLELEELLSTWINYNKGTDTYFHLDDANNSAEMLFQTLRSEEVDNQSVQLLQKIIANFPFLDDFLFKSHWLIYSNYQYNCIGMLHLDDILLSGENINVLVVDSTPQGSGIHDADAPDVHDIGLHSMSLRSVYVASVALYFSYSHLLTVFHEAAVYNGPSIIFAYLPDPLKHFSAVDSLIETQDAVNAGKWPLYRHNPSRTELGHGVFKSDSPVVNEELNFFLDQRGKDVLVFQPAPTIFPDVMESASAKISKLIESKAEGVLNTSLNDSLVSHLYILYASDGGNAASLAKELCQMVQHKKLGVSVHPMEEVDPETLLDKENIVFITSTAGQGEFPQNGRKFWEELKSKHCDELDFSTIRFAVFGLGDSQYWSREEDQRYYNRPAKLLYKKLKSLHAEELAPLGLGDDQDDEKYYTRFKEWVNILWKTLGVYTEDPNENLKEKTTEDIKIQSNYLRGTIAASLLDITTGRMPPDDVIIAGYHGLCMLEDHEMTELRKLQGMEPLYTYLVRLRNPQGTLTPDQWILLDDLSEQLGDKRIRVTDRASIELNGILKDDIKHTIRALNSRGMDTRSSFGDVCRDILISALPESSKIHTQLADLAKKMSEYFLPNSSAYDEIWLAGSDDRDDDPGWPLLFITYKNGSESKVLNESDRSHADEELLYGTSFLPGKFEVNITVPPHNDASIYSADVGLISIVDLVTGDIQGFNVVVGGKIELGECSVDPRPETGRMIGYVPIENIVRVIEIILVFQGDNGDRNNHEYSRLGYTVDKVGFTKFKELIEKEWGRKFGPPRPFEVTSAIDSYGWTRDELGLNHFTTFLEYGCVEDTPNSRQKTGLRKIAELMKRQRFGEFRLTGNRHIIISNVDDKHLNSVRELLRKFGLAKLEFSGLRLSSSMCQGPPTCVNSLAKSEKLLPTIVDSFESVLRKYGLMYDPLVMKVACCSRGCFRAYLAEVALIGTGPNTYNIYLGGGYAGDRPNCLYKKSVRETDVPSVLEPLFRMWSVERSDGEHFGDFVVRTGII